MIAYPNEDRILSTIRKLGASSVPELTQVLYDYKQTRYPHGTGYEYTRNRIRQTLIRLERDGTVERKRIERKDLWKVVV